MTALKREAGVEDSSSKGPLRVDRVSSRYRRPAVQPRLRARRPVSSALPPLAGHKLNGPFGRGVRVQPPL